MTKSAFDITKSGASATEVDPVEPAGFNIARYVDYAAAADEWFEKFWQKDSVMMV